MTKNIQNSLSKYLKALSSKNAVGGGSAVSYVGAMACALSIMALEFSDFSGKRKNIKNFVALRDRLLEYVDVDVEIFTKYLKEKDLKKKKALLKSSSQQALSAAKACARGIGEIERVHEKINSSVASDMMISYLLFEAAIYSQRANLEINSRFLKQSYLLNECEKVILRAAEKKAVLKGLKKKITHEKRVKR